MRSQESKSAKWGVAALAAAGAALVAALGTARVVKKRDHEPEAKRDDAKAERDPHQVPRPRREKLWVFGTLGGVLVVALLALVVLHLRHRHHEGKQRQDLAQSADKGPTVLVAKAQPGKPERTTTLPGDVRAFNQIELYAKVTGYLTKLAVDKGDRVHEGELLATITSPETDEQVAAAQADLVAKKRLAERARALAPQGVISQQDLDTAESNYRQAAANLERTRALKEYEVLRAPFDGVVTARNMDPGSLVNAGGTMPVLEITDASKMRITVYVAQDVATFLKVGDLAEVRQDERPDRVLRLPVTRVADALDARSRTMLAEIQADNAQAQLLAGTFVHVTLHVAAEPLPSVPTEAVLTRTDKNFVALVQDGKLHFQEVTVAQNDGKTVTLRSGLKGGETVALNPPLELGEGAPVQAREQKPQSGGGGQSASASNESGPGAQQSGGQGDAADKGMGPGNRGGGSDARANGTEPGMNSQANGQPVDRGAQAAGGGQKSGGGDDKDQKLKNTERAEKNAPNR